MYTRHHNIYYWPTANEAKQWAFDNKWPTDRIIEYKAGWAIQAGKSGNYAGPRVQPRLFGGGSLLMSP